MKGLYTEVVGPGRPRFAFLHGLFGRGRNWTQIAHRLAENDLGSVLFDLPNHGRSTWTKRFDYQQMAEVVAAEIDLRLGSAAGLILVGHSMGGKVAMLTALQHPELVPGLAVVDIGPGESASVSEFTGLIQAMRGLDLATLGSRAEADALLAAGIGREETRQFLLQNLRRKGGWHWQLNLDLLADSLPAIGGWPEIDAAPYLGPTTWILGEKSDYVSPHLVPEMTRLFPNLTRVVVPGATHWVHSDAPDATLAALLELAQRVYPTT